MTDDAPNDSGVPLARRAGASTARGPVLFELSTEVCNQVGGIYQVIRSKASEMMERWGSRYCLVGAYNPAAASIEFEERRPSGRWATLMDALERRGVRAHIGQWLIPGRPRAILLEHTLPPQRLDQIKYLLWEKHRVESPAGDPVVDTAVCFADASFHLVQAASEVWPPEPGDGRRNVLAHFHEWLGGLAIPMLRDQRVQAATVFTTHATLLGRYMASNDERFYDHLPSADQRAEAARFNVRGQHGMERACAHGAHVFTTVSPITAEECLHLLGRQPELVTPNGLNIAHYDLGHEFQMAHAQHKERLHRFTMGYFFPSYTFDLDRTLYLFTSGRYEPRNKGFDLCLEAMARLNAQLKSFDLGVTVVFIIVTRQPTKSINPLSLQCRGVLNELEDLCTHIMQDVGRKLFPLAAAGQRVDLDRLVDQYWAMRYRRTQQALKAPSLPPVVTHMLWDDAHDPVLNHIRALGLFNRAEDPVKVVYHPEFISSTNPLWQMDYDQFVRGCHLGVFPSAYEPWGYTPLECIASGVPAITSDLAGFGRFVAENDERSEEWGLTVLPRRGRAFHDAAADLARRILQFCRYDRRGRIDIRNQVVKRAPSFDWSRLARYYHAAHDLALDRSVGDA
ncbi:MAG TPA: glycogen synthase [Phycisphaerales bacterium]|nr:glycogen synthase [Phycisphaerales bacterium]